MTSYHPFSLDLTEAQKKNISRAHSKKHDVKLLLNISQLTGTGNDKLLLNKRQINRIQKDVALNTGAVEITLSFKQLQRMQQGGALPFLAPLVPLLATAAKSVLAPLALSAASTAIQHGVAKAIGSGMISINVPKKHIEGLNKVLKELEKRSVIPAGSLLTVEEHLSKQNGGFILPLVSTLLGTFLPTLFANQGSGIYFPFDEKN